MKTYPKSPREQFDAVKPETINDNLDESLGEFNGNLDANNMPINSVTQSKWNDPNLTAASVGSTAKWSVEYPTQAYHSAKRHEWTSGNILIFSDFIELTSDSWSRGFNRLDAFGNNWDLCNSEFVAKQGMLVGQVTIDWERGTSANLSLEPYGFNRWTEWAVFVNNILVARSGQIYPRRHTTCLPFSIPIGSQNVKVEARWRTNFGEVVPLNEDADTPLLLFGVEYSIRNQYR